MARLHQLSNFIQRVASDDRLKPTHISLYFALCHIWIQNMFQQCYNVSRKQLMGLSRIRSKATYHKVMKELTNLGYINYRPSYHPFEGSEVSLLSSKKAFRKRYDLIQGTGCFDPTFVKVEDDLRQGPPHFLVTSDEKVRDLNQVKPDLKKGEATTLISVRPFRDLKSHHSDTNSRNKNS